MLCVCVCVAHCTECTPIDAVHWFFIYFFCSGRMRLQPVEGRALRRLPLIIYFIIVTRAHRWNGTCNALISTRQSMFTCPASANLRRSYRPKSPNSQRWPIKIVHQNYTKNKSLTGEKDFQAHSMFCVFDFTRYEWVCVQPSSQHRPDQTEREITTIIPPIRAIRSANCEICVP